MCKQELPATSEYFARRGKILQSNCKTCKKEYDKVWYKKNKEEKDAQNRAWYHKNAEARIEQTSAWQKANPEKRRGYRTKQRALKLGNEHSPYTETEMLKRYGTVCYLCNEPIDFDAPRTGAGYEKSFWRDHVVALTNGGPDTLDNVKPSHAICNILKGTKEQYEIKMA